jgi:hypothetical protein
MPFLILVVLLSFPYIDLEIAIPLGTYHFNAPLADIATLALFPLIALSWRPSNRIPLPGLAGWLLLLLAGLCALPAALDSAASLHFLVRKPLFLYIAYGGLLAWGVACETSTRFLLFGLCLSLSLTSLVSIGTSILRIQAGDMLWFQAISGLTNNHKTLAVALAPLLPLILGLMRQEVLKAWERLAIYGALGAGLCALAASVSKTAWIAAGAGCCWFIYYKGRSLAERKGLVAVVVGIGLLAALYGPIITGSLAQLDAARSRHSLNKRAFEMFLEQPLFGMGGGSNVLYIQQIFPDYRVNGVDAHGVFQKIGSEFGLVGLCGYLLFFGLCVQVVRAKPSLWPAFVALHINLLLSTETFSQTHWLVFGLIWGLAHKQDDR